MLDWTQTMSQSYRFYKVDPVTWMDGQELNQISDCSINWDSTSSTLGSASITTSEILEECYIRTYMVAIQNGVKETIPIGTFLYQMPSNDYDGKCQTIKMNGYTPLMELKEKSPSIGYTIKKGTNYMTLASELTAKNTRAPVITVETASTLSSNFTAGTDDTWLTYLRDLIATDHYTG